MLRIIPLFLIRVYQYMLSPVLNPACRFYPTCAEYAYRAISRFGLLRGSFLALKRVLRCHPLSIGGFDPVPSKTDPEK